ncbi:phytoene/squalene synthase family protein [Stenotrophomonas sp. 24(2023)]|uniref:phytoene/squalene synthase family protein n=1 Tax=Stenotrophomonas sp. 24(2023) TaxID=3068324 RepID=UPI0027E0B5ED|nr:phytoene/squalene synthase family protein [Stenotrophomonas sp. 24(2023)]WMJ69855.1 phytoene/squalene synthase family protein [Stenotrophomonas sp. 24(2023)]
MSSALDSFLDKWRTRWPEWSVAEPFVPEAQRLRTVAWFALLQEFDDMLNTSGDPLPADAKLAWWGEELRSWAGQRSRHPLGRVLEPARAPWVQLADALPDIVEARSVAVDAAAAERALAGFAEAVAAVEAVLFEDAPGKGVLRKGAGRAVLLQTLAQRLYDAGVAGIPRALLAGTDVSAAPQRWAQQLLKGWAVRVPGPRPRRIWSTLARARLAAQAAGKPIEATPVRTLLRVWWAARG